MAAPPSAVSSPLGRQLAAGRRGELVTLPILGAAWCELLGSLAHEEVEAQTFALMRERGYQLDVTTATSYELVRARLTLARAMRDPEPAKRTEPFGTAEEWAELDPDVIGAAWQVYGDVRERLDPFAGALTEDERITIATAVKKKDGPLLRSFGVAKLSAWLLSTDVPPSISPQPSSSNSDS